MTVMPRTTTACVIESVNSDLQRVATSVSIIAECLIQISRNSWFLAAEECLRNYLALNYLSLLGKDITTRLNQSQTLSFDPTGHAPQPVMVLNY